MFNQTKKLLKEIKITLLKIIFKETVASLKIYLGDSL